MNELLRRILDDVRGAWRFRRLALVVAWLVCLLGWGGILMMPDIYQASARVYVDTRAALGQVLQGLTIQQDVNTQLNLARQSLLSRPQLERVIRETDLDSRIKTPEARLALVERLTKEIRLSASDLGGGGVVFTLEYQNQSRDTSLKVVELLMNWFIEETLGGKRVGSEVAQKFLVEQIEQYEQRLREAEERLAEFKRRNVGLMPGAQGDYFTRLQTEIVNVEKAQGELSVAMRGRGELQKQLRGEALAQIPGTIGAGNVAGDTGSRIIEAQTKLDDLRLQYTERHPDVIALRETIAQLELRRADEIAVLRNQRGAFSAGAAASPVVQSIQLAINKSDVEIAALGARIADGQRKVAELRNLVDTAPEVEAEFARLNRDYEGNRERYMAFVDRAERTKLGDKAEATDSVRFELIDPPSAKFEPVAPNRPLLLTAVFLVSISAGCGLAFVIHQLKPVFNSSRTLNEVTGLPVYGVVSMTWLDKHRFNHRMEYIKYSAGAAMLLVLFVFVVQFNAVAVRLAQKLSG